MFDPINTFYDPASTICALRTMAGNDLVRAGAELAAISPLRKEGDHIGARLALGNATYLQRSAADKMARADQLQAEIDADLND